MTITRKKETTLLFVGDILFFLTALWLTLLVRYFELPDATLFYNHLLPFSLLFLVWTLVFFISGLYDKHTILFKRKLPDIILQAQVVNVVLAALFFFFIPYFNITPKTNLVIYLLISSGLILIWRLYIFPRVGIRKKDKALLIGGGKELQELYDEINGNSRYTFEFTEVINVEKINDGGLTDKVFSALRSEEISAVVVNPTHKKIVNILPHLYKPILSPVRFFDANIVYEDIFDRVPLSSFVYDDFFDKRPILSQIAHDVAKRTFDIVGACVLGFIVLSIYPFIYIAVKLEDGGDVFIKQKRIGQHMKNITTYKFRSMLFNEEDSSKWIGESKNKITRVGKILRRTSIDEWPQVWNIFKGEMSFIGPRNDVCGLGARLSEQIPYYNTRYTIKPGLSGWAQINQRYMKGNISPQSVEESRIRLAYDIYYIKNRSFILDIKIALRTIQTLALRFSIK